MVIKTATYVKSAVKPEHYPPADRPEVAFVGRSNVGKSSLINSLVNQRHLVKTSSTPGRTQLISFFAVNDAIYLVDLPGYGYAKVPLSVQRTWRPMVDTYLSGRPTLRAVVMIMDIRRLPRSEELELFAWLGRQAIAALPVLSKVDKLSRMRQQAQQGAIARTLAMAPGDLILYSAKSGQGRTELWQAIEGHITAAGNNDGDQKDLTQNG
jgi:GTP-binding protein